MDGDPVEVCGGHVAQAQFDYITDYPFVPLVLLNINIVSCLAAR